MDKELCYEPSLIDTPDHINGRSQVEQYTSIHAKEVVSPLDERYVIRQSEPDENMKSCEKIKIARHQKRPTSLDLISLIFTDFIELHGDRLHGDDLAVVGGLAKIGNMPITVLGQQRGKHMKDNIARCFGSAHPEGFRKALRLMHQANKFGRPIITFIDTKGAYPGDTAEQRGQSAAIAQNLREMAKLTVPVVAVVIGEGGSGGALAIAVANRVLMLEHAIYSVISPDGAASILWKDCTRMSEAADAMKITAQDLYKLGVIDEIISEPKGGAHCNDKQVAQEIRLALERHLEELVVFSGFELKKDRYEKFRCMGQYGYEYEQMCTVSHQFPSG